MKLSTIRLVMALAVLATAFAVPSFMYLQTQISMGGGMDLMFYGIAALFAGVCLAGGCLFLVVIARRGTLPVWFWQTN